jgi:hypothetical protein
LIRDLDVENEFDIQEMVDNVHRVLWVFDIVWSVDVANRKVLVRLTEGGLPVVLKLVQDVIHLRGIGVAGRELLD